MFTLLLCKSTIQMVVLLLPFLLEKLYQLHELTVSDRSIYFYLNSCTKLYCIVLDGCDL